jgi:hypothetical protein
VTRAYALDKAHLDLHPLGPTRETLLSLMKLPQAPGSGRAGDNDKARQGITTLPKEGSARAVDNDKAGQGIPTLPKEAGVRDEATPASVPLAVPPPSEAGDQAGSSKKSETKSEAARVFELVSTAPSLAVAYLEQTNLSGVSSSSGKA